MGSGYTSPAVSPGKDGGRGRVPCIDIPTVQGATGMGRLRVLTRCAGVGGVVLSGCGSSLCPFSSRSPLDGHDLGSISNDCSPVAASPSTAATGGSPPPPRGGVRARLPSPGPHLGLCWPPLTGIGAARLHTVGAARLHTVGAVPWRAAFACARCVGAPRHPLLAPQRYTATAEASERPPPLPISSSPPTSPTCRRADHHTRPVYLTVRPHHPPPFSLRALLRATPPSPTMCFFKTVAAATAATALVASAAAMPTSVHTETKHDVKYVPCYYGYRVSLNWDVPELGCP